jgi:hypothetical protein
MTIFPSFCHSSLRNRSSSSDLCRHYLSACSPRFFQNTFKGRSSRSHRSAISFSLSLVQFWTSSGAPQGHPSLTFAVYSSNPPRPPSAQWPLFVVAAGADLWCHSNTLVSNCSGDVRCQFVRSDLDPRPPQRMHRPTSGTHYRPGSGHASGIVILL